METMQFDKMRCNIILCNATHCNAKQCKYYDSTTFNVMQHKIMQHNALQRYALQIMQCHKKCNTKMQGNSTMQQKTMQRQKCNATTYNAIKERKAMKTLYMAMRNNVTQCKQFNANKMQRSKTFSATKEAPWSSDCQNTGFWRRRLWIQSSLDPYWKQDFVVEGCG